MQLLEVLAAIESDGAVAPTDEAGRLPRPDSLPPQKIDRFDRIDSTNEIRKIARQYRNCLADFVFNVNDGTSAVYLSETARIVCFLTRIGRLGWVLSQVKGPSNADIDRAELVKIHAGFAKADIPDVSIIEAIKEIVFSRDWPHPRLDRLNDDLEFI